MTCLYSYTLKFPLTYSTYHLHGEDSEMILGLENPVEWLEPCYIDVLYPEQAEQRYQTVEQMQFCVSSSYNTNVSDDGQSSFQMPDNFFMCSVSGVVAESKEQALQIIETSVIKACKTLSVLMSCNNCNKQGYQPRVAPNYKQIEWYEVRYEPYEELRKLNRPDEYIDENGNRVICLYVDSTINMRCEVHSTIFGKMPTDNFMKLYQYERSEELLFVMDEFYTALGTETVTSKFFHLFAIIEFIEKKYGHLADTSKLFTEEEKKYVKKHLNQLELPKIKQECIKNSVANTMSRATEHSREAKLVNILHNMGIMEIKECGTPFVVNIQNMGELIWHRNFLFHGDSKKEELEKHISIETGVAWLMYICEKIIIYISENHLQILPLYETI